MLIASSLGGRECVPRIANGLSNTDASIVCVPHLSEEAIAKAIKDAVLHKVKTPLNYNNICTEEKAGPILMSNEHRRRHSVSQVIEEASEQIKENLILIIGPGSGEDGVSAISTVIENGGNVFALTQLPDDEYFAPPSPASTWALEMPNAAVSTGLDIGTGSIEDIVRDVSTLISQL